MLERVHKKTYGVPVSMMPIMTSLEALFDRRPDSEFKKSHDRVVCSSRTRSRKTDMTSSCPDIHKINKNTNKQINKYTYEIGLA